VKKEAKIVIITFLGSIIGILTGVYGPWWYCQYMDHIHQPPPHSSYKNIGWIYMVVTVPISFLTFTILFYAASRIFLKEKDGREK